jgi:hypothetical protein
LCAAAFVLHWYSPKGRFASEGCAKAPIFWCFDCIAQRQLHILQQEMSFSHLHKKRPYPIWSLPFRHPLPKLPKAGSETTRLFFIPIPGVSRAPVALPALPFENPATSS